MKVCGVLGALLLIVDHAILGIVAVAGYTGCSIRLNELGDSPLTGAQNRVMDENIRQGALGRFVGPRGARFAVLFPFYSIVWAGLAYLARAVSHL